MTPFLKSYMYFDVLVVGRISCINNFSDRKSLEEALLKIKILWISQFIHVLITCQMNMLNSIWQEQSHKLKEKGHEHEYMNRNASLLWPLKMLFCLNL